MTKRKDIKRFTQEVDGPPTLEYVRNDSRHVTEDQVLVGYVMAPRDKRRYLADHGVDVRYADFDPTTDRWEPCLFSVEVLDLLAQLQAEGDFPYLFAAEVSDAESDWRERQARGETERAPMPLWRYLVPASPGNVTPGIKTTED